MIQTIIQNLEEAKQNPKLAHEITLIVHGLQPISNQQELTQHVQRVLIPTYGAIEFTLASKLAKGHDISTLRAKRSAYMIALYIIVEALAL